MNHLSELLSMYTKESQKTKSNESNKDALAIFGTIINNIQKQIEVANYYNQTQRKLIFNIMNYLQRSFENEAMNNQIQLNPMASMLNINHNNNPQYNPILSSLLNTMPMGSNNTNSNLPLSLNLHDLFNQTPPNSTQNINQQQLNLNQIDNQRNSNTAKSQINNPSKSMVGNTIQGMYYTRDANENSEKLNPLYPAFQPFINSPLSPYQNNIQMPKIDQQLFQCNNSQIPTSNQRFSQSPSGYDPRYQQSQLQLNERTNQPNNSFDLNQLPHSLNHNLLNQNKLSPSQNDQVQKKKEE